MPNAPRTPNRRPYARCTREVMHPCGLWRHLITFGETTRLPSKGRSVDHRLRGQSRRITEWWSCRAAGTGNRVLEKVSFLRCAFAGRACSLPRGR